MEKPGVIDSRVLHRNRVDNRARARLVHISKLLFLIFHKPICESRPQGYGRGGVTKSRVSDPGGYGKLVSRAEIPRRLGT